MTINQNYRPVQSDEIFSEACLMQMVLIARVVLFLSGLYSGTLLYHLYNTVKVDIYVSKSL